MTNTIQSITAVAQKLEEKAKLETENMLKVSGSAVKSKNDYGVTVVSDKNTASSYLFKPLTKNKFDNEEIIKAINVGIKELKPNIPKLKKDLVPRPLYDGVVQENNDLNAEVDALNTSIEELNNTIADLEATVDNEINNRLGIEQRNDLLVNQLDTLTQTIDEFAEQISVALQKSIEESILRTSLQAQNEGFKAQINTLIKQIDSLNSIIEGLQSRLGAVQIQQALENSAESIAFSGNGDIINDVVVSKISKVSRTDIEHIFGVINVEDGRKGRGGSKSPGNSRFVNGEKMIFNNTDTSDVQITISITSNYNGSTVRWLNVSETNFTIKPGGNKEINLNIFESAADGLDSKPKRNAFRQVVGYTHSQTYTGGVLTVKVKRATGVEASKNYDVAFRKSHPDSFNND